MQDVQFNLDALIIIPVAVVLLVIVLIMLFVFLSFFRPWLTAFLSGSPISMFELIGMRLRRTDPKKILPHGIASAQAGFPVPWASLERAHLQGIDLEKVTTAYVTTHKRGNPFTFDELVDAERDSRLDQMLGR